MTNLLGVLNTSQVQLLNGLVPKEGPRAVPVQLDFTATTTAELDFALAQAQARLTGVQAIWIDNTNSGSDLVIVAQSTGQRIVVKARHQGSFPVIGAIPPKFVLTSSGGVIIESLWLNVPIPANEWGATHLGAPTGPVASVIAAGGTPVNVFASLPINGGYVTNPIAATESLFVDIVNAAGTTAPGANGTTTELAAGQSFTIPPNLTGALSANAVTNGHTFTAVGFGS